jgi:hypothetical protein
MQGFLLSLRLFRLANLPALLVLFFGSLYLGLRRVFLLLFLVLGMNAVIFLRDALVRRHGCLVIFGDLAVFLPEGITGGKEEHQQRKKQQFFHSVGLPICWTGQAFVQPGYLDPVINHDLMRSV